MPGGPDGLPVPGYGLPRQRADGVPVGRADAVSGTADDLPRHPGYGVPDGSDEVPLPTDPVPGDAWNLRWWRAQSEIGPQPKIEAARPK